MVKTVKIIKTVNHKEEYIFIVRKSKFAAVPF